MNKKMVQQLLMTEMVEQTIRRRLKNGMDQVLKILGVEVWRTDQDLIGWNAVSVMAKEILKAKIF